MKRAAARGFTLIEVMMAAMMLTTAIVGSIALVIALLKTNQTSKARDTAYFLLQETLDQWATVPLATLLSAAPPAGMVPAPAINFIGSPPPTPTAPICYAMTDDALIDRPVPCIPAPPAAYYVRSWICCSTTSPGGGAGSGAGIALGACSPNNLGSIAGSQGFLSLSSPDSAFGGVCLVQAEVTWPVEDTTQLGGITANPTGLFQDSVNLGAPAPSPLSFNNHVYGTAVREQ